MVSGLTGPKVRSSASASETAASAPTWRVGAAAALAAAGAFALSAVIVAAEIDHAVDYAAVRAAIETAGVVVLVLAAGLVLARGQRSGLVSDVVLGTALAVLAVSAVAFRLEPCLTAETESAPAAWGGTASQLLGLLLIATAALPGARTIARPRRLTFRLLPLAIALVALLALLASVVGDAPSAGEIARTATGRLERDQIGAAAVATGAQLLMIAVCAVTASLCARQARIRRDPLLRWTAIAVAIWGASRLDFLLWPDLWMGDVLRLASHGALLWGSLLEIDRYQRRAAQSAIFEERRRMARDLHDGLAAELAYIAAESRRLAEHGTERRRAGDEVVAAAERALEESRLAISALTRPVDEPLDRALHHALESAAERLGVGVVLDLSPAVTATPTVREALLRVALEALRNAARHGRAREGTIQLRARGDGLEMMISDDGRGFDVDSAARPDAIGLLSMRERVEALGGSLRVVSGLGEGTRVEAALP